MKRAVLTILIVGFISSLSFAETNFVEQVIDARTLKLITGEKVRLIGLDPVESLSEKEQKEAADFIRSLVSGYLIEIEYDVERTDEDGYLLGYVWFEFENYSRSKKIKFPENYEVRYREYKDGYANFFVFLNATLIKSGYGAPTETPPNTKHAELFKKLYAAKSLDTARAETNTGLEIQTAANLSR